MDVAGSRRVYAALRALLEPVVPVKCCDWLAPTPWVSEAQGQLHQEKALTTTEKAITALLEELHDKKWTDAQVAYEMGVTGQTVYRWRHERSAAPLPKLVRAKLEEILGRNND